MIKTRLYCIRLFFLCFVFGGLNAQKPPTHLIFCSDVHFGLTRSVFRNGTNVSSSDVNAAMVGEMNKLPSVTLPKDGGVGEGQTIGGIEAILITGDLCNRQETDIQSASTSWNQFKEDYIEKLHLRNKQGTTSKLLLTPGNHDISNAIGFHRPMLPLKDNATMVGIYNLMMQPATPITGNSFDFQKNKIHYSVNIGGIHLLSVSAWPDSSEQVWMKKDLEKIPNSMPAFIFTHSDPSPEARFFTNPNGDHSINETDKFENLVEETFKDGATVKDNTLIEQRAFVSFLQAHPNIKAYFHGHTNFAEFYDWKGPDNAVSLPCFRADSPMKGRYSAKEETKLSFNLISIDTENKKMTVRECLWNAHPDNTFQKPEWGIERTISF